MILIHEIATVVILTPRTGSGSLKQAIAEKFPAAIALYRHMEADGVPAGYDRWRRVGVVRHPLHRLWSLYKFIRAMADRPEGGKWERHYVATQMRSAAQPFGDWIVANQTVFTSPYDAAGLGRFWPSYSVRHPLPETRKSQFVYLRPDLGTEVFLFDERDALAAQLGVELGHINGTGNDPAPPIDEAAVDHVRRFFAWDLAFGGWSL